MSAAQSEADVTVRLNTLARMPNQQKIGLMVLLAAAIALATAAWIWSQTPDYRILYNGLSDREGGAIIAALQQMNVPYKVAEHSGAITIPANQVHEMRLRLASQGLPKGNLAGFELMENQKFGSSQFLEQINYQRALEGELARSIQSLSAVDSARVHLAISKPSVFAREQSKPSASILLNLHHGKILDPEQVSAIIHLISSSVPNMPVKNVTVVDQNGSLLSSQSSGDRPKTELDPGQIKYMHELEYSFVKRIEDIITPIVGPGNVQAQVTADIDFSHIERAEETYKPNNPSTETATVRSQQSVESLDSTGSQGGGVPGALSNQPPVPATAPITTPAPAPTPGKPAGSPPGTVTDNAASSAPVSSRKESTTNYEVDKKIQHIKHAVGNIKRLSAAVVVNYRTKTDAAGKQTRTPLTAAEITMIQNLVKEAMGYSQERGDTLSVANSQFDLGEKDEIPETPIWKDPDTHLWAKDIAKQLMIAGILLFFIMKIVRPYLKKVSEQLPPPPPRPAVSEELSSSPMAMPERHKPDPGYEQNLQMAKQLAVDEPGIVASVVKEWVAGKSNNG